MLDSSNVESQLTGPRTCRRHPLQGEAPDPLLFGKGDRFDWMPKDAAGARLDFAKYELAATTQHEIQFAIACPPVAIHDLVPPSPIPVSGQLLSSFA